MSTSFKIRRIIWIGIAGFSLAGFSLMAGDELSSEAAVFLANRPSNAQAQMTQAVRDAMAGNPAALKKTRGLMLKDATPPAGIQVENTTVSGQKLRFYYPEKVQKKSIVLYLHGGGWTIGGMEGSARFCGDLAKQANIHVATLDYRLAPEHPAPAALEDVLSAIKLLQSRGYCRIYLSGDSAGGNLAAAAALKLRSQIAGTVLYYPVVLAKNDASESWQLFGQGFGLDGALMEAFNESYAPGKLAEDPLVSPLLATEFDGYPETLIVAAECDVLYDQGKAFGERLKKHGTMVEHKTVPGALHAFMTYPNMERAYWIGLQAGSDFIRYMERKSMNAITKNSIVRLSKITVDPAQISTYLTFATECGKCSMAEEPGVLMMFSMQDKKNPEQITILEIYADQATYEQHIKTPHFQKYKQGTLEMVRKLELLDQIPLIPEMKMK